MKKHELTDKTAEATGQTRGVVRQILDAAADVTRAALARRDDVFLFGLGKLSVVRRGEKVARHMTSGERVIVPARNVAHFRPSESVDRAANGLPA
jgi:DNA-binding protein HU-beta